jgi:acyl-CoA synthetase (AMP-forming)/AMP-acid ligase II
MKIFLLDEDRKPILDCGRRGEIYIGGHQQSTGYLSRPSQNAKSFIELSNKELGLSGDNEEVVRLYKTGDLGTWRSNSDCLDFHGRSDTQIKYRGFRVELGEIGRVLLSHEGVQAAVVIRQPPLLEDGMEALVVFIAGKNTEGSLTESLMDFARERLPSHMLPTDVEIIDELPLLPNDKVDRKTLIESRMKMLEKQNSQSQNETGEMEDKETVLYDLWKEFRT